MYDIVRQHSCKIYFPEWIDVWLIFDFMQYKDLHLEVDDYDSRANLTGDVENNLKILDLLIENKITFRLCNYSKSIDNYKSATVLSYTNDHPNITYTAFCTLYGYNNDLDTINKAAYDEFEKCVEIYKLI